MTRILQTIGPQGAGKSTFCESLMAEKIGGVAYASRDRFLVGRYGSEAWNPYSGAMQEGMKYFWQHVAHLASEHRVVLLECFCDDQRHFSDLQCGISLATNWSSTRLTYEALWFDTPNHICAEWYVSREQKVPQTERERNLSISFARSASRGFRRSASRILWNFETIWHIDPRQLPLFSYSEILGLRA